MLQRVSSSPAAREFEALTRPNQSLFCFQNLVAVRQQMDIEGFAVFHGNPPAAKACRFHRRLAGNHFAGDQIPQAW